MKKSKNRKTISELNSEAQDFIVKKKLPNFRHGYEYVIKWNIGRNVFSYLTNYHSITDIQTEFKSSTAVNATLFFDNHLHYLQFKNAKINEDMRIGKKYRINFMPVLEYWYNDFELKLSDDEKGKLQKILSYWMFGERNFLEEMGIDIEIPTLSDMTFTLKLSEEVKKQMGPDYSFDKIEGLKMSPASDEMARELKRGISDFDRFRLHRKEKYNVSEDVIWNCEERMRAFLGEVLSDLFKESMFQNGGITDMYIRDFCEFYLNISRTKRGILNDNLKKELDSIISNFSKLKGLPEPLPIRNEQTLNYIMTTYLGDELMIKLFKSFKTYKEALIFQKFAEFRSIIKSIRQVRENIPINNIRIKSVSQRK